MRSQRGRLKYKVRGKWWSDDNRGCPQNVLPKMAIARVAHAEPQALIEKR